MSANTVNVTEIADTARRVARTALQVIAGFGTFAILYVAVVQVLGHTAGISGTTAGAWLATSAVWVTGAASLLAKIMAIPQVNELLDRVNLGGQSTIAGPADSETRMIAVQTATPVPTLQTADALTGN